MRGVLKALVAVELQLPSGLLFSHSITDGVEYKAHRLIGSGFVGDNAVVKEVTDDGKVQDTLRCVNIRYVGYPLLFFYHLYMCIWSRHTNRPLSQLFSYVRGLFVNVYFSWFCAHSEGEFFICLTFR